MIIGIAKVLVWADVGGLWLAVIGMFAMSAAVAEDEAGTATTGLAGLLVADVITAEPHIGAPG